MAVTTFQDLPMTDRAREWDGDAAEKRVRAWAGAEDGPNERYRDAHVWYDADNKDNFTAYKLRVKNHLAKYYKKMDDQAPWERRDQPRHARGEPPRAAARLLSKGGRTGPDGRGGRHVRGHEATASARRRRGGQRGSGGDVARRDGHGNR